jgi:adenylate kinase
MRVILMGPPGSGKGTQGDLIERKYDFPKISTGDLLRHAVQNSTPLGKKAETRMNRGELVSDDIVVQIVAERIEKDDCRKGYVLDGFPRNLRQAEMLEELENSHPEIILDIQLNEEKLIQRLSSRRICSLCGKIFNLSLKPPDHLDRCDFCKGDLIQRRDDRPNVIKERLRVYHMETAPLVEYYQRKKNYHRIDGEKAIENVFLDICSVIDSEIIKFKQTGAVQ